MLSTKMIVIISLLTVAILLFLSRKILDGFLSRYIFYTRLKIMLGFATFRKIIQVLFYLLIIAGFIFLTFIVYDYIWKSLNQMITLASIFLGVLLFFIVLLFFRIQPFDSILSSSKLFTHLRIQAGFLDPRRFILFLLVVLCTFSLIFASFFIYDHISYKQRILELAKSDLVRTSVKASKEMNAFLREAMESADGIAGDMTAGKIGDDRALDRLRNLLRTNSHIYGVGIVYRPYSMEPNRKLYAPYFKKTEKGINRVQLDGFYDYTLPENTWYILAMDEGARWSEPFYDEAAGSIITRYAAPFSRKVSVSGEGTPAGVITVDISMDAIKTIIESLDLGASGYGSLTSNRGIYLYHPDNQYVQSRYSVFDVARENGMDGLVMSHTLTGERGILDFESKTTGRSSWLVYEPIQATGWTLYGTFIKDDVPIDIDTLRQQLINTALTLILFLALFVALLLGAHRGHTAQLWAVTIVLALLFLAGIGYVWHLALSYNSVQQGEGIVISDNATLNNLMNTYTRNSQDRRVEAPAFIPTGVYIESIRFIGSDDVMVTGYVWQKYSLKEHEGLTRGFSISRAENVRIREVKRHIGGDTEVIRWFVQASLRQRIDYSKYPLVQGVIGLRIKPVDLDQNAIPVPDINSYNYISPTALPGLEEDLVIPGWKVKRSFFELISKKFNTDFGISQTSFSEAFPTLHFNVAIQKNFLDSFVSHLTPLFVVVFIMFFIILTITSDVDQLKKLGTGTGRILSVCAAMFFVIIFAHIDVRQKISAEEIFYLEYFYFVMYLTLLWTSINSILFVMVKKLKIMQYRDNFLAKLLFLPFVLGLLFAITVIIFY